MANVLNRTTGLTLPYRKDYRTSVNTGEFPDTDWIINPDLTAVSGFDSIYWDISGDNVILVDASTRDARDAEIAAAALQSEKDSEKARIDNERVLVAFAEVVMDEINLLRAEHALPDRTLAQLKTAIKNKIDGGV